MNTSASPSSHPLASLSITASLDLPLLARPQLQVPERQHIAPQVSAWELVGMLGLLDPRGQGRFFVDMPVIPRAALAHGQVAFLHSTVVLRYLVDFLMVLQLLVLLESMPQVNGFSLAVHGDHCS